MLALETFKTRRCSTCTEQDKKRYGCESDVAKFRFDGEYMTRCPLRPFKENPKAYSEFFQLYSFKEKNALSEPGGFYDQPNAYLEIMSIMDSAVSDSYDIDKTKDSKIAVSDQEQQKTEKLASLGIPITKK